MVRNIISHILRYRNVFLMDNLLTTRPPEAYTDFHLHLLDYSLGHVLDLCSFSVNTDEM